MYKYQSPKIKRQKRAADNKQNNEQQNDQNRKNKKPIADYPI